MVTTISSNDSPKASSAPASSADRIIGNVISTKVRNGPAPRSADACSSDGPRRCRRACTLLNTVTMQNVACAITTVRKPRSMPSMVRKALLRAMPVTMPGSAIGRMISSDTVLRPKKRVRRSASPASVPSTRAITVASSATSRLVSSASRAPVLWAASFHQCSVNPLGGQANVRSTLKEFTSTRPSGT